MDFMLDDQDTWWLCPSCCTSSSKRLARAKLTPYLACMYQKMLYAAHPLHVMLLSLLDVSMSFADRARGFLKGGLHTRTLVGSALLTFDLQTHQFVGMQDLPAAVSELYSIHCSQVQSMHCFHVQRRQRFHMRTTQCLQ